MTKQARPDIDGGVRVFSAVKCKALAGRRLCSPLCERGFQDIRGVCGCGTPWKLGKKKKKKHTLGNGRLLHWAMDNSGVLFVCYAVRVSRVLYWQRGGGALLGGC